MQEKPLAHTILCIVLVYNLWMSNTFPLYTRQRIFLFSAFSYIVYQYRINSWWRTKPLLVKSLFLYVLFVFKVLIISSYSVYYFTKQELKSHFPISINPSIVLHVLYGTVAWYSLKIGVSIINVHLLLPYKHLSHISKIILRSIFYIIL